MYGPGHCCFIKPRDDKEDWIIYHAAKRTGARWSRNVRAQRFDWIDSNTPKFGKPIGLNKPIALPSGDSPRIRYEAETTTLANGAGTIRQDSASGGAKVGRIDHADNYVEFSIHANQGLIIL